MKRSHLVSSLHRVFFLFYKAVYLVIVKPLRNRLS